MSFKFPFTNYHELNLTWVLDQLKKLFEESADNVAVIENYDGRLTAVETELPTVSENAAEAARSASAAASLAQTAKATADTAQENAIQAQRAAGTAQNTAVRAQEAADAATQAAQQAQATALNFDGRITQAENDASQALEASRSFENRVQSAITTANNANQTATNAQGIAMRADQNAAAALDKIGDLSELDTTAKQNLVVAINEVKNSLDEKQNAPAAAGTSGQVLGLNSALEPVWLNQSGGQSNDVLFTAKDWLWKQIKLFSSVRGTDSRDGLQINNNMFVIPYGSSTSTVLYGTVLSGTGGYRNISIQDQSAFQESDFINISPLFSSYRITATLEYFTNAKISGSQTGVILRACVEKTGGARRVLDLCNVYPDRKYSAGKMQYNIVPEADDAKIAFYLFRYNRARCGGTYIVNFEITSAIDSSVNALALALDK